MAGIALLLDLVSKNPSFNAKTFHSCRSFSASVAASAAAASVASPLLSRASFGFGRKVAYCDAGAALPEDVISSIQALSGTIEHHTHHYITKEYRVQLKPLHSAFQWKHLALVTLRSFLANFLPLVEPHGLREEDDDDDDDDDFLEDNSAERGVDLVVPFKKSIKQIIFETTVSTTRRILERISVYYVSQRTAWKLLKDVSVSAMRKAGRDLPITIYFYRVTRSTFRGHILGVAASWLVHVIIDIYRFLSSIYNTEEADPTSTSEKVLHLRKNVYNVTLRCGASLIFASIGAGIGATVFRPYYGQLIGCLLGDLAGPTIVSFCVDKLTRPAL